MAVKKPLAQCPRADDHFGNDETILTYDVPNDVYFVACMICGCEGMRCSSEQNAKANWRTRKYLSREPEHQSN